MDTYDQLNFATVIPDVVKKYANNIAMGFVDEEQITYAEMGTRINAVKAFLEALDIKPGDKVVVYSQNMPNWGITYFALQCLGIVTVPVLPDFNPHEIQNVLVHSEAKAIFVSKSLEYKLKDIQKDFIEVIVRLDDFEIIDGKKENIIYNKDNQSDTLYFPKEKELAILLYTSGTTGDSKGVMLTQKNVVINAFQGNDIQNIYETDKFLSVLPLSHTYENTLGLILPILKGASITYLRKPPTAAVLIPAMQKVRPSVMLTVPMIIEKVYRNSILPKLQSKAITRFLFEYKPGRKLLHRVAGKKLYKTFGGKLTFFGIGGAKLDPKVERFLRDAKFPYAIGYGLTETAPMLAGSNPRMTKFQAVGPKVFDCELKIHNPNPVTGEGEVWAKGPNIMLGYYKNKEKTREVLTEDGWFKTGDLCVFDESGWLSHKGRIKNLIVGANGENIYPEEVESLINNFRHVIESIVIEKKGKLQALVHFNREELELRVQELKADFSHKMDDKIEELSHKVDEAIDELAEELQNYINSRVNKFSRIQLVVIHPDPFQKTATLKIKRHLYC